MTEQRIELQRTWRVWLTGSKPHLEDVVGVRPMVDEKGMLAFADSAGNLAALFAAGMWAVVKPGAFVMAKPVAQEQEK